MVQLAESHRCMLDSIWSILGTQSDRGISFVQVRSLRYEMLNTDSSTSDKMSNSGQRSQSVAVQFPVT